MANFWMVRAGEGGYLAAEFEQKQVIGMGWDADFTPIQTIDQMRRLFRDLFPGASHGQVAMAFKFRQIMQKGDRVVTYNPATREYLLGDVVGEYQ
jgi:restriction system protein